MTQILTMRQIFAFLLSVILFSACKKETTLPNSENEGLGNLSTSNATGNGMTITEGVPFTATAMIAYCWGENVRISGMIENHVKVTTTPNGNHYTRHWVVKGLTGVGLTTGASYIVTGGAEMFSIKNAVLNANGSLNLVMSLKESDIVIHQGSVMLENVNTGAKVLARHIIRKVPGRAEIVNKWVCGGGE